MSSLSSSFKTIGILGGMGPEATAATYQEIIRLFQEKYNAKYDSDFPEIVVVSKPIPDVVENLENPEQTVRMLLQGIEQLKIAGADFAIIACNTVQIFIEELRQKTNLQILSIPEEVAKVLKTNNVALLATEATINARIFDKELQRKNIVLTKPDQKQQGALTKIIMNILNGNKSEDDRAELVFMIDQLKCQGAEAVILGCTDLPLLVSQEDISMPVIDTIKVSAAAAVREAQTI